MQIKSVTLDVDAGVITYPFSVMKKEQLFTAPLSDVMIDYANGGFFDTGLIPVGPHSGVVCVRGGLGHLQVVYQIEPGAQSVMWGQYERDESAKVYSLAQPWRIWIADFFNNNLSGIRHFYTTGPVTSGDDLLYHVNLPNTNCKGYNGTGVGWMCLYHHDDTTKYSIAQLIAYAYQRASGSEAYNDNNMSNTDGPRYYAANNKPKYWTDPATWQAKTIKEGFEWALDEKLLLPVMVASFDDQSSGHQGTVQLTVDGAMNGTYYSYYPSRGADKFPLKPIAALRRGLLNQTYPKLAAEHFEKILTRHGIQAAGTYTQVSSFLTKLGTVTASLASAQVSTTPYTPHGPCYFCKNVFSLEEMVLFVTPNTELDSVFDTWNTDTMAHACASCLSEAEPQARAIVLTMYKHNDGWVDVFPDELLWVHSSLLHHNDTMGAPVLCAYSETCDSCGELWPNNFSGDWKVYSFETGEAVLIGCHSCQEAIIDAISGKNIPIGESVDVVVLRSGDGTDLVDVSVSTHLVGPHGTHEICACNQLCNKDKASGLIVNEASVCLACVTDGEYVPVRTKIETAISDYF